MMADYTDPLGASFQGNRGISPELLDLLQDAERQQQRAQMEHLFSAGQMGGRVAPGSFALQRQPEMPPETPTDTKPLTEYERLLAGGVSTRGGGGVGAGRIADPFGPYLAELRNIEARRAGVTPAEMKDFKSAEEFDRLLAANVRPTREQAKLTPEDERNLWITTGLRLMGGKSPSAMENLSAAGLSAMQDIESKKERTLRDLMEARQEALTQGGTRLGLQASDVEKANALARQRVADQLAQIDAARQGVTTRADISGKQASIAEANARLAQQAAIANQSAQMQERIRRLQDPLAKMQYLIEQRELGVKTGNKTLVESVNALLKLRPDEYKPSEAKAGVEVDKEIRDAATIDGKLSPKAYAILSAKAYNREYGPLKRVPTDEDIAATMQELQRYQ